MSGDEARANTEVATEGAPPPPPPPPPEPELEKLQAALEAATRRVDELLDRLRRAQADYENLQKRSAREIDDVREVANEALLASLLPVLDDFDHEIGRAHV